ncbi:MAG: ABC transporter ATP-binding protein [Pannonibacter phragmitetus]|uniref:ABC transporter ATP-binding protein n=2 Tax=Pannonibacter TaxID=227873 RepID=A0A0U3PFP9_9HYPH|nr:MULTISPECIES: ABC transporter ATP-binding protein [Pannonibacter]ALV26045.1 ABC transporter ATP-binding protein [Pannonibacter phragmitetus]MBA4207248.1 high-affinity branched-chain amino acid ABC transporter ATP-binding protein LivF [Polymorphum sp.]CUA94333.1 amino acid/amide ABC transporter ATP-binding protein 2, HAAT family (TC 3.A.1.4.-) [Pannonibacter indicus]
MSALLTMQSLTGGYGETNILNQVSMTVNDREIVVIVGPNGAGKSTAMKAIFGLLTIRGGSITFDGTDITSWAPNQIVQRGICYVPQVDNIFREMSIHENLEMGAFLRKGDLSAAFDRVYTLFPDLKARRKTPAGNLSGGQRQMVAMGRALMLDPKLLLLDEPTAGLSPKYMEQIFQISRDVRDTGVAILLVEQHAKQALAFADRAYVLAAGANRHEGTGQALLADREVAEMFLGG